MDLIERLRALSRHEHDDASIGAEAADEIERLTKELDAMRLDAERYRWLREGRMEFGVQAGMPDFATKEQCWWKVDYTPEEADAAIDAAMKEKP